MNPVSVSPYVLPALPRILITFCYNAGLLAAIGLSANYLLVLRPSDSEPRHADGRRLTTRLRGVLSIVGVLLIIASYADFAVVIARSESTPDYAGAFLPTTMARFISAPAEDGDWLSAGIQGLVQYALLVVAGAALVASRSRRVAGRGVAIGLVLAILGVVVSALPTASGALSGDDLAKSLLVQVHIVGAAVWAGGLFGLGLLALLDHRPGGDRTIWSQIWARFSHVAAFCVGGVLISGLWLTWKHVGSVAQFVSTPYGRFLAVKIILVLIMIAAGGYNQQVLLPRIARLGAEQGAAVAVRHLGKVARIEAVLGVLVVGIVPFLSGSARKEVAGGGSASPIDGRILALGLLLITLIAFGLWSANRFAKTFGRVGEVIDPDHGMSIGSRGNMHR